jgi:hypothetical protein
MSIAASRYLPIYHVVVAGQVYPSYALSAVNRQPLGLNRLVLPVAHASECPNVLYAAFPSKARRVIPRPAFFFFLTKHALIGLSFNCFGMSPRQPSIPLEVAPERHLLNWLFVLLSCHNSGLMSSLLFYTRNVYVKVMAGMTEALQTM